MKLRKHTVLMLLLIGVTTTYANRSCPKINLTENTKLESCSDSNNAFSVCTIECARGFEIASGDKRQICWCMGERCSWQGFVPTCKVTLCSKPDYNFTKFRYIDSWDTGFAHLVEFENIPTDLTPGWGLLVVFNASLGESAVVKIWGTNLIKVGDRKYLLKSSSAKFRDMFADKASPRCLISVFNANSNAQRELFVGLYKRFETYDDCFDPITSPELKLPPPTLLDKLKCPNNPQVPTVFPSFRPILHRTPSVETTIQPTTTTSVPTTVTKSTKIPTLKKLDGMNCKTQRGETTFGVTATWDDEGFTYYSGNVVVNTHKVLSDWKILVVFNSIIGEVEVWDSEVEQYSDSGNMWTFGPHSWNTILDVGDYDISFIAKELTFDDGTPNATIYLCSKTFKAGDTIITKMPGRENAMRQPILNLPKPGVWNALVPTKRPVKTTKLTTTIAPTGRPLTTPSTNRCSDSAPMGVVSPNAPQTTPETKLNIDGSKYNYNQVLHLSILYYEAQRSGYLPNKYKRIPWRGHSALKDGCEIGHDLSKGWFDAGDHVKFNFPMAFSVTTLSWGGILFRDAYRDSGELNRFIGSIRWPVEYLMACHIAKNELIAQVGNPALDHMYWGRPEEMSMRRPTYKLTWQRPGSDLAGETAAAFAAASIVLKKTHTKLAKDALKHARELFTFADTYRGKYDDSVIEAKKFYKSTSGYEDELLWSAVWLYKATREAHYLTKAIDFHREFGGRFTEMFSWDDKMAGAHLLLANLTGEAVYRDRVAQFVNKMMTLPKTPDGQVYYNQWGPNRYTANVAFIALVASTLHPPLPRSKEYFQFAQKQINILLGDGGRSYVVGFGKNYPTQYHHRSSSCPSYPADCNRNVGFLNQGPNRYTLYGALVGGPDENGQYDDLRSNVKQSETACDYNAGFQSAVAGLKHFAMKLKNT